MTPRLLLPAILALLTATPGSVVRAAEPPPASVAVAPGARVEAGRVLEAAGTVEHQPGGSGRWLKTEPGTTLRAGDRLRTAEGSRAALQLSDRSVLRLGERTTLEIQPPRSAEKHRFGLLEGLLFLFNRERPADVEFETPITTGAIRGTEFVLASAGNTGPTRLMLLDGRVELTAAGGSLQLAGGEQATVEPGSAPVRSPLLEPVAAIQWALHYPAILSLPDLGLTPDDSTALAAPLADYRAGDLLAAQQQLAAVSPGGVARELFRAALELAVGRVERCEAQLGALPADVPVARALHELIAVVRGTGASPTAATPATATEWLARSYSLQAGFRLKDALAAAEHAAGLDPDSGFALTRVAELRFAFERRAAVLEALGRALEHSPRLAQAQALRGFVRLEQLDPREALASFDGAIAIDAALGSAWLGRGLALLRLHETEEGLQSLQAAAALDPRRALYRSYLGKGFSETGEAALADKEFRLARELDPADPAAWLYSALHAWQENRPNVAVRDLERSVELNDERRLFRSRLALDRDLAVREADLAAIYRDAGLPEVSLQSAAAAVSEDYAGFAGHLFLANSYQALEDPNRFDLRLETARQSELLVANLLAPPGAANLSQRVSQQEHLRFFDARPLGVSSLTEYRSTGDWRQEASFFGTLGGLGYALDTAFAWQHGQELNDTRERRDASLQLKQRVLDRDEVYLQAAVTDAEAGDAARHHDPADANPSLRVTEEQLPNLHVGWHREWSPESHTLLLASRLTDRLTLDDSQPAVLFARQTDGTVTSLSTPPLFELEYASRFTVYAAELQHLWQTEHHALVLGARGQAGEVESEATLSRPLTGVVTDQSLDESLVRFNAYALDHWRILDSLKLIGGIGYDRLDHPLNSEVAPLTRGETTRDLVAPRAGLLFAPWRGGLLRAAWSRSLGGVSFDNSVRLEPAQIAGFNQAYRSLLPESVAGLVPGTRFETLGLAFDQSLPSQTWLGIGAELLTSDGDRTVGVLTNSLPLPIPDSPSSTQQELDYREHALSAYAVQLIGDGLALGARYRVTESTLAERFPGLPAGTPGLATLEQDLRSTLHQVALSLSYRHSSGVFGQWESDWYHQDNSGYQPARSGADFWQHNAHLGYRLPRHRAEIRVGVLNLTDTDYRLSPLNPWLVLPRQRTAVISLRLDF